MDVHRIHELLAERNQELSDVAEEIEHARAELLRLETRREEIEGIVGELEALMVDDMLAILFPHMFEDIEFLLPPGGEQEPSSSHGVAGLAPRRLHRHVNAEAGPSRLAVP
ncbi:hypothetical protein PAXINDRAFT_154153 [Paxillus involutus ATCC 200175]|nr:hypothetical protein PAXINDRAFT_154153 [Paxillus involutus ATCC 200175]